MNKFVSGGLVQMCIVQLNITFFHGSPVKVWGAYCIRDFTVSHSFVKIHLTICSTCLLVSIFFKVTKMKNKRFLY